MKNSYYHLFQGRYVIVSTRTTTFLGRLEDDNFDTLTLRPSIVHEPRLQLKEGKVENTPHYRLETELPTIVNSMEVVGVQPTTEEHVRRVVDFDK
jgi:hypothetical protein